MNAKLSALILGIYAIALGIASSLAYIHSIGTTPLFLSVGFSLSVLVIGLAIGKKLEGLKNSLNISWDEKKIFIFMLVLSLISGIGAFLISNEMYITKVYVQPYKLAIDLSSDRAIVTETLTYHVPPDVYGHEFYRSYYANGPLADMTNISIECPEGFKPKIYNKTSVRELACRSGRPVAPGIYTVIFHYTIPKPYSCYTDYCLFDWNVLTRFSLDIKDISISVTGADKVWAYPGLNVARLYPRTLLEVKALVPRSKVTAYFNSHDSSISFVMIKEWTTYLAAFIYNNPIFVIILVLLILGAGLYGIYWFVGREKPVPGVPDVFHDLPNNWKPYQVNAWVYGNPTTIEDEGIQATLLDLARRGVIRIKGSVIEFLKEPEEANLDSYELKVYKAYRGLARSLGSKNRLDIEKLKGRIMRSRDVDWLSSVSSKFDRLRYCPGSKKIYDQKARYLAMGWLLIMAVISATLFNWILPVTLRTGILGLIFTLASCVLLVDIQVFGRYRDDIYKDILMWRAFGRLLGDYSLIKKYAPEDIRMWGKWLVYATALGKAENVIKAMKELNIKVPNIDRDSYYYTKPYVIYSLASARYVAITSARTSGGWSGGSGWSGGGGFGGGFGGGGGGFR